MRAFSKLTISLAALSLATVARGQSHVDGSYELTDEAWRSTGVGFREIESERSQAQVDQPLTDVVPIEVEEVPDPVPTITAVEPRVGSECGLSVTATSPGAVGDPCMSTQMFISTLSLTREQRSKALADVADAANAVAH